jgi:uncharacterized membrane protein (UPF0182 family)
MQRLRRGLFLLLGVGLGILAITALASFYVDLAWFAELHALPVLWTRVIARWGLGLGAFLFALAVTGQNCNAAAPRRRRRGTQCARHSPDARS